MKVAELTETALDWAVAKCEGHKVNVGFRNLTYTPKGKRTLYAYAPSTTWSQGGPIIERERICPCPSNTAAGSPWSATDLTGHITQFGPTPLVAAMRCYVASKLGDDIDLPKELT